MFDTEVQREKSEGVFSPYGMPYRFGFYVNKGSKIPGGIADAIYYGMHFGNINSDRVFSDVGCWIAKSYLSDGMMYVYKYKSGPIVIFLEDEVVAYVAQGASNTLWNQSAPAQYIFDAIPLSGARVTFLDAGYIEERALIYQFRLTTTKNRIEYVEKKQIEPHPFFTTFYSEYNLKFDVAAGTLYIGLPETFVVTDLRTEVTTKAIEEGETAGLCYDTNNEFGTTQIELVPTGTTAYVPPEPPDPEPDPPESGISNEDFVSIELREGAIVAGRNVFSATPKPYYYTTDIVEAMSENELFILYATLTLPAASPLNNTSLNSGFAVTVAHVVGDETDIPGSTSVASVIPLCTVSLRQGIYSITENHPFSCKVGGGGIIYIHEDLTGDGLPDGTSVNNALRWDYDAVTPAWLAAPPLDSPTSIGSFTSGEEVVVGAQLGDPGLIQLLTKRLTLPLPSGGITAHDVTFQGGIVTYNDDSTHKLYQYDVKLSIATDGTLSVTLYDKDDFGDSSGAGRTEITQAVSHATQHP